MPQKKKPQKPEIVFDEATHRYTVDGSRCPSTTQIIGIVEKHALNVWKTRMAAEHIIEAIPELVQGLRKCSSEDLQTLLDEALDLPSGIAGDAADHGRKVHSLIELYLKANRKPRSNDPEIKRDLDGFGRWKQRHKLVPEALEEIFYHAELGYCCRPDYVGLWDGTRAVLDWKTGGFHPLPIGMQLAANAAAVEDMTGKAVHVIAAIHIDERGLPHWRSFTEKRERYWQKFVALLNYWKL